MKDNNPKKHIGDGGLKNTFLLMTVLPLMILGIFIVAIGYRMYTRGLENEVKDGLNAVGQSVICAYDSMYEGDYNLLVNDSTGEMFLRKGDTVISDDNTYIDRIKETTGVDITLFFYDKRMMTTITDENERRVIDTAAHMVVSDEVLTKKCEKFYSNVSVGGREYYADYIPIFSESGVCLGMIGAAKEASEVKAMVNGSMLVNMALIVLGILVVAFIIARFAGYMVTVINRMMIFWGNMAKGNLDTKLDETILKRRDEIGQMGRFTVHVQGALKKLIEKDALTGIFNRGSGQKRITAVSTRGGVYSVAMADIDFFKKVNDTYGHDAGDEVLKTVAKTLSEGMIGRGFACRWGGEEFLLVFVGITTEKAAGFLREILDKIRATTVFCGENDIKITMSFGVTRGDNETDTDEQIKRADNGLYYAKTHGRNQVVNVDIIPEEELAAAGENENSVVRSSSRGNTADERDSVFDFVDDEEEDWISDYE